MTLGNRAIKWNFIVAEMGDDEGILGNDFAMAHELTVRPCEGAVYLPNLSRAKEKHPHGPRSLAPSNTHLGGRLSHWWQRC